MQQTLHFSANVLILFNVSHVIKTITTYVQFSLSYVENAPLALTQA